MKKFMMSLVLSVSLVFVGINVFANPAMLPAHPGYPMSAVNDPVIGKPLANDPGRKAPSVKGSLTQASAFHDVHALNPQKEVRPNIVYDHNEKAGQQIGKK
jgi:hypothetical protein